MREVIASSYEGHDTVACISIVGICNDDTGINTGFRAECARLSRQDHERNFAGVVKTRAFMTAAM